MSCKTHRNRSEERVSTFNKVNYRISLSDTNFMFKSFVRVPQVSLTLYSLGESDSIIRHVILGRINSIDLLIISNRKGLSYVQFQNIIIYH